MLVVASVPSSVSTVVASAIPSSLNNDTAPRAPTPLVINPGGVLPRTPLPEVKRRRLDDGTYVRFESMDVRFVLRREADQRQTHFLMAAVGDGLPTGRLEGLVSIDTELMRNHPDVVPHKVRVLGQQIGGAIAESLVRSLLPKKQTQKKSPYDYIAEYQQKAQLPSRDVARAIADDYERMVRDSVEQQRRMSNLQ